ncbi:MAG: RES family NAD+ phosphorylase [Planctomycetes bacterium]|nr:RES family NAD+ phosphorylase [Planctomycetota bacterium]
MATSRTEDDFASLVRKLGRLTPQASAFEATGYRSASPRYATETDLLTGEGSRRCGGRWNPPGLAAVYASLTPETAMAETLALARYSGWAAEVAMPRTFVAMSFNLKRVLDLTDGNIRRRLAFSRKRMIESDWRAAVSAPLSQLLGQAAAEVGLEGLLVPSAVEPYGGRNIVAFPRNIKAPKAVVLLSPGKL